MKVFVVLSILIACTIAAPGVIENSVSDDSTFDNFVKYFGNCADSGELTTCLAVKGISVLNRAARSANIDVIPGVTFARDTSAPARGGKSLSENEIMTSLPADKKEKHGRLFDLAMESMNNFLNTHSLQFKVPAETRQEVARAFEEGRGKMKKVMGPLALAIGAKLIAVVPLVLGGLVLLATKALVIAKIAFVLAAVLGLQKLLGGGSGLGGSLLAKVGGGQTAAQQWPATGNAGWPTGAQQGWSSGAAAGSYPYARSYDAQDLAYSAQAPAAQ
jgi:hypothetical protein